MSESHNLVYNASTTSWEPQPTTTSGTTSNTTSVTGVPNTLPMARYNASPTVRTEGQFGNLQADPQGNLNTGIKSIALPWSSGGSSAYESGRVIKAGGGNLRSLYIYNSGASQFIQLHNSASAPADTTAPLIPYAIGAGQSLEIDFGLDGLSLNTGIYVCNSTTGPTKTIGAADCWFFARYS